MRAVDVKSAAYMADSIDRAIESASDDIDNCTARKFYAEVKTASFDWPSDKYPTPWTLWLDQNELADEPTLVVTGSMLSVPVTIPSSDYILNPGDGPPYTSLDLRRDLSSVFGAGTTPQNDIEITGLFGYWTKTRPGGVLGAAIANTTTTSVLISNSQLAGVGDVIIVGTERMLVTNKTMADTGVAWAGITDASASDNVIAVADGSLFAAGEVLLVDAERVLIQDIANDNLIVKRAWDGTLLDDHTAGTLYANRQLTVVRGSLGSTAATHLIGAAITVSVVPAPVVSLAIALASVQTANEPGAYSGGQAGEIPSSAIGSALDAKWSAVETGYARKVRQRTV